MKNKLILILLLTTVPLFPQWEELAPFPVYESLMGAYFLNEDILLNAGFGCLIKTTTSFAAFEKLIVDEEGGTIGQIKFTDDTNGFIIMGDLSNYGYELRKTIDAGNTWSKITDPLVAWPKDLSFISNSTGWLLTLPDLVFTSDGGSTWELIFPDIWATEIDFINRTTGFTLVHDSLYKTVDGGFTWSAEGINNIQQIEIKDSLTWMLLSNYTTYPGGLKVYLTTDAGASWMERLLEYPDNRGYTVFFEDSTIIISADKFSAVRSDDNGVTWNAKFFSHYPSITSLVCSKSNYYQFGHGGTIRKSTDQGETWLHYGSRHGGIWLQFVDPLNGYTAPWFTTTDGGDSWTFREMGLQYQGMQSFHFTSVGEGILIFNRAIGATTDGGITWDIIFECDPEESIGGLYFMDSLYVIGFFRKVPVTQITEYRLRTSTDAGKTWSPYFGLALDSDLDRISFITKDLFFATIGPAADYGMRSTDGGHTWHQNEFARGYSLSFIDSLTGWAVKSDEINRLIKTTDAGVSFSIVKDDFSDPVKFLDSLNAWTVDGTIIYKSTDGGVTWDSSYQARKPVRIQFVNNQLYAIGGNGALLRNSGGITDLDFQSGENKPGSYSLSQNYPNPFNPSTVIKYNIPEKLIVSLKVYDMLGNLISVLINEEQPPGNHEVEFKGLLSSGVYFYRLQAGSFTETKKMILVK